LLALALAWIQEGCDVIFNYADWADFMQIDETIVTAAGTVEYFAQAIAEKIVSMRITSNDAPLTFYTRQELEEMGLNLDEDDSQGEPAIWYPNEFDAGTPAYAFNLYPVPDAVYEILITERAASAALTANSTLPLPQQFRPALKEYIRSVAFYNDGKVIEGQRADGRFNNQLGLLRKKILQPANHTRLAVSDMPSSRNPKWQRGDASHFNNRKW